MISRRFVTFVVVSGLAAGVNLAAGIVFRQGFSFTTAAVLAFGCGLVTAFILNRLLVFRGGDRPVPHQAAWFALVNLAGLAQTVLIGLLLARMVLPWLDWTWHPDTVAHAIGIAVPVVTSYLGHKHLSFRGAPGVGAGHRSNQAPAGRRPGRS